MNYVVYTDGAASGNGKADCICGWAYCILDENENIVKEDSGAIPNGTNNIGELMAIRNAILAFNSIKEDHAFLTIYSDSAYCVNGLNDWRHNWKKNDWTRNGAELKNKEIWKELDSLLDDFFITVNKVKGHTGKADYNDRVDKMAVKAVKEAKK